MTRSAPATLTQVKPAGQQTRERAWRRPLAVLTARKAGFEEANGALSNSITRFIPPDDQEAYRH
ncbi:MAG: hypothetical protein LCH93_17700 [Proteobacteria bacterium]|nr:hypothetical protein [Pseudomonadota bacterium]